MVFDAHARAFEFYRGACTRLPTRWRQMRR
jgi:hypothetical protein